MKDDYSPSGPFLEDAISPSAPFLEDIVEKENSRLLLHELEQALSGDRQRRKEFFLSVDSNLTVVQNKIEKACYYNNRIDLLKDLITRKITNGSYALFYAAVTGDDRFIRELISLGASLPRAVMVAFADWNQSNSNCDLVPARRLLEIGKEKNIGFVFMEASLMQGNRASAEFLMQAGIDMKAFEDESRINILTVCARLGLGNAFRVYLYEQYLRDDDDKVYRLRCNDTFLWNLRAISAYHGHTSIVRTLDNVLPKRTYTQLFYNAYAYSAYCFSSKSNANLTNGALDYPKYQQTRALKEYQTEGFQEDLKRLSEVRINVEPEHVFNGEPKHVFNDEPTTIKNRRAFK